MLEMLYIYYWNSTHGSPATLLLLKNSHSFSGNINIIKYNNLYEMNKNIFLSILFVGVFISITSAQVKYTSSGNLGIGQSNPLHAVHIKDADATLKLETSVGQGNTTIRLAENYNYIGGFIKYNGSSNLLKFGVHSAWDSNEQ